jgi:hypothetical protein
LCQMCISARIRCRGEVKNGPLMVTKAKTGSKDWRTHFLRAAELIQNVIDGLAPQDSIL